MTDRDAFRSKAERYPSLAPQQENQWPAVGPRATALAEWAISDETQSSRNAPHLWADQVLSGLKVQDDAVVSQPTFSASPRLTAVLVC